jgi:hypothetical protein
MDRAETQYARDTGPFRTVFLTVYPVPQVRCQSVRLSRGSASAVVEEAIESTFRTEKAPSASVRRTLRSRGGDDGSSWEFCECSIPARDPRERLTYFRRPTFEYGGTPCRWKHYEKCSFSPAVDRVAKRYPSADAMDAIVFRRPYVTGM